MSPHVIKPYNKGSLICHRYKNSLTRIHPKRVQRPALHGNFAWVFRGLQNRHHATRDTWHSSANCCRNCSTGSTASSSARWR